MAWQQASPDGGPLRPMSWRQVGDSARESAREARIAKSIQHRERRAALLDELAEVEAHLADLESAIHDASTQWSRSMVSPLDLPRAVLSILRSIFGSGRPERAPSSRLRAKELYARLASEKVTAIERRGRIRLQLAAADEQLAHLFESAAQKAADIVTRRREGWQQVERSLADVVAARTRVERIDSARKRVQDAVAAVERAEAAVRALLSIRPRTTTERIAATHRADDAVRAVGRFVRAADADLRAAGAATYADFDQPLPRIGASDRVRRAEARAVLFRIDQVRLRLESLDSLDEIARVRREQLVAAQDIVVDLMRRPY
ncbi:MAG TPA: hypothetical protein GXZ60_10655 [Intrasporangiaceae bacterium]|nr:hypothetical protein [Intrasporangiaceae bacterium]